MSGPSYDARKRAADKLAKRMGDAAERGAREKGQDQGKARESAEKYARDVARETDKKNGNG